MHTRSDVCDRLAIHPQTLDCILEEFPSLFRSEYTFTRAELKFLAIIQAARRDGVDDHHGVWVRLLRFIRQRPALARLLSLHPDSVVTERYLRAVDPDGILGPHHAVAADPLVAVIGRGVMERLGVPEAPAPWADTGNADPLDRAA